MGCLGEALYSLEDLKEERGAINDYRIKTNHIRFYASHNRSSKNSDEIWKVTDFKWVNGN